MASDLFLVDRPLSDCIDAVTDGYARWADDISRLRRRSARYRISNTLALAHSDRILTHMLGSVAVCSRRPYFDDRQTGESFHVVIQENPFRLNDDNNNNDEYNEVTKKSSLDSYSEDKRLAYTNKHEFSYHHLYHCGSVVQCPICASRILYKRSEEHKKIIKYMLEHNHSYFMVTFTARHTHSTDIKDFIQGFLDAQRDMYKDKRWKAFKKRYAIKHYISTRETTFDDPMSTHKSGPHFHIHTVFFTEAGPVSKKEGEEMSSWLRSRWVLALSNNNLFANKAGVKVSLPYTKYNRKNILESTDEISKIAEYLAKSVSFELSGMNEKSGRKKRRFSAYQLMNFCALNYRNYYKRRVVRFAFHQLNQYFAAMKGIPWRTVSRGLYKLCNIKQKEDEELVYGQKENPIYKFTNAEFNLIVRQRAQIDLINALQVSQKIIDTGKDHAFEYVDTFDGGLQRVSLSRYISEAISPQSIIKHFIDGFNIWTGEYIEQMNTPERPDISSFDDPADPAFDEQCDIITLETNYDKKIDDTNIQFITIDETYRQRMDEDNQYIEKEPSVIELLTTEYNAYPAINNDERDTLLLNFRHDIDENARLAATFFVAMNLKKISEALKMNLTGVRQATETDYDEKIQLLEVNSDMTEKSGSVLKTLVNKYCAIPLLPYDRTDEILLEFEDEANLDQNKKMEALYFISKNLKIALSELDLPAPWRGVTHVRAADADAARLAYAALYY